MRQSTQSTQRTQQQRTQQLQLQRLRLENRQLAEERRGADREDRISELARRNALMPPHLRSSYAPEMNAPGQPMADDELRVN